MNPPATLGAYAAALVVVFGAAAGVGSAVGPVGAAGVEHAAPAQGGHGDGGHAAGSEDVEPASAELAVGGLAVASDGYSLALARTTAPAGQSFPLELTIYGPDGEPLLDYARAHGKELHLVVVRRDLSGFTHVHPTRDAAGRWSVPLLLREPGAYKVIADFTPAGRDASLALAADLTVPGTYAPRPLPAESRAAEADGFLVTLDGDLTAGRTSELTFTVRRDGRPVTDLDPYLGAYGHLVVLRAGDGAYLHVHPDESGQAGPAVVFGADVPAAGPHRLFLDFSVDGVVRTAALTVQADGSGDGHGSSS